MSKSAWKAFVAGFVLGTAPLWVAQGAYWRALAHIGVAAMYVGFAVIRSNEEQKKLDDALQIAWRRGRGEFSPEDADRLAQLEGGQP